MRKINVVLPNKNSEHYEHPISPIQRALLRNLSSSQQVPPSSDNNAALIGTNAVYIRYKYPRIAIGIHFIMKKCFDTNKKTQQEEQKNTKKRSHNGSNDIIPLTNRLDSSRSALILKSMRKIMIL
jgi:hypothetical protein